VTIDVGTGDGRAVLAAATRAPRTLVLGLDAVAAAMAESSRRAAGPARKGGLPNAAFVVGSAEAPPAALCGIADLVTVRFPWGSLLRGCVGRDEAVAAGIAGLVRAGGTLELLLAPAARDGLEGMPTELKGIREATFAAFARHGFDLACARAPTPAEVAASGSTWARRLGSQRQADRFVMLVRLVRPMGTNMVAGGSADGLVPRQ
jgi:16S rRNA (adenine(1408)-N(1))-methyltransferase